MTEVIMDGTMAHSVAEARMLKTFLDENMPDSYDKIQINEDLFDLWTIQMNDGFREAARKAYQVEGVFFCKPKLTEFEEYRIKVREEIMRLPDNNRRHILLKELEL